MLDGLAAQAHGVRELVEPPLHGVEHSLVLPTFHAFNLFGRTAWSQFAVEAGRQVAIVVDVAVMIRAVRALAQVSAGRASVMVGRRVIDKIAPHEEPALGSAGSIDLWHAGEDPGCPRSPTPDLR